MEGWISLHRKIQDNRFYPKNRPFTMFEAWIDLLLNANHTEQEVIIGYDVYICKRGQQLRSQETLAKRWNWSKGKVRRVLQLFKTCSMIELKPDRKTTQITICNYGKYQSERTMSDTANEPRTNRERTANGSQTIMNNNENNENNFLSEKVNFEFEKFRKNEEVNKRPVSQEREKALIESLNIIASADDHKIAVIKQAIAGNHPAFRSIPDYQKKSVISENGSADYIPTVQDFEKYFKQKGYPLEKAVGMHDDFAYNKKWKDSAGFSIKETWTEVIDKYFSKHGIKEKEGRKRGGREGVPLPC